MENQEGSSNPQSQNIASSFAKLASLNPYAALSFIVTVLVLYGGFAYGIGYFVASLTGWPLWPCIWLALLVKVFYT